MWLRTRALTHEQPRRLPALSSPSAAFDDLMLRAVGPGCKALTASRVGRIRPSSVAPAAYARQAHGGAASVPPQTRSPAMASAAPGRLGDVLLMGWPRAPILKGSHDAIVASEKVVRKTIAPGVLEPGSARPH